MYLKIVDYMYQLGYFIVQKYRNIGLVFKLNNLFILKKNNSLKFFIQKNSTPKPYEVKWKVRNKGVKAKSHGVRGKIINDNGTESKTFKCVLKNIFDVGSLS